MTHASRFGTWARAFTRRFAAPARRRQGLTLCLQRRRASIVLAPHVSWNPTIAVNVSASYAGSWLAAGPDRSVVVKAPSLWRPTAAPAHPADPAHPARHFVTVDRVSPVERILRQTQRVIDDQVTRGVVTRVVSRADRIETRATGRDLVLAAPAAIAAKLRSVAVAELSPSSMSTRSSVMGSWSSPGAVAPPINVDRIADQVLQQLDRRIGAWRERTGRA